VRVRKLCSQLLFVLGCTLSTAPRAAASKTSRHPTTPSIITPPAGKLCIFAGPRGGYPKANGLPAHERRRVLPLPGLSPTLRRKPPFYEFRARVSYHRSFSEPRYPILNEAAPNPLFFGSATVAELLDNEQGVGTGFCIPIQSPQVPTRVARMAGSIPCLLLESIWFAGRGNGRVINHDQGPRFIQRLNTNGGSRPR
jgi:hypothetical protein